MDVNDQNPTNACTDAVYQDTLGVLHGKIAAYAAEHGLQDASLIVQFNAFLLDPTSLAPRSPGSSR